MLTNFQVKLKIHPKRYDNQQWTIRPYLEQTRTSGTVSKKIFDMRQQSSAVREKRSKFKNTLFSILQSYQIIVPTWERIYFKILWYDPMPT